MDTENAGAPRPGDDHANTRQPKGAWRTGAALIAATLSAATFAGCGDDGEASIDGPAPSFEATPQFLQAVAQRSTNHASRYEVWMGAGGTPDPEASAPFATGMQDEAGYTATIDARAVMEVINNLMVAQGWLEEPNDPFDAPELADVGITFESATVGSDLYLRMPAMDDVLAADGDTSLNAAWEPMAALEDGQWAHVDMDQFANGAPSDQDPVLEWHRFDPGPIMDLLNNANDPQDIGEQEIRGVSVRGLSVSFDPEAVDEVLGSNTSTEGGADAATSVEIWVDGQGLVRRITVTTSIVDDGSSEPVPVVMLLDLFDYGDSTIEVTAPDDTLDLTEELGPGMLAE